MIKIPKYKIALATIDFIVLLSSFHGAVLYIHYFSDRIVGFPKESLLVSNLIFSVASFSFIFLFQANNLYKINIFLKRSIHFVSLIKSLTTGIIILIVLTFLLKFPFIVDSRFYIIIFSIFFVVNFVIVRILLFRNIYLTFSKWNLIKRKVAIVGAGKTGKMVATKLLLENSYGITIVGFFDDYLPKGELISDDLIVLGGLEDLPREKSEKNIEEVIIAIDNIDYARLLQIIDICNELKISIKVTSELFSIIPQKLSTEHYFDIPTVNVTTTINERMNFYFKRTFDFIAALFGIILLLPLFLILALLIKISSKGPILYTQDRIGFRGSKFKFYKFRSMSGSEEDDKERELKMLDFMKNRTNGGSKIINEKRVTWIGKIIRKTSVDELPQLINVLKGEMSLVGPRPCLPYEFANYDDWQKRRVSVLPGCTGLWQVSGRSEVSFKDSVVLDLYYINNMSPWLDLQILLKTLPVMIFSRGGK